MIPEELLVYEYYIDGKMTYRTFIVKGLRAKEYLKIVYTDIYEPFSVHAWGGMGTSSLIDEDSRFGYVYLVHRKSDALDTFIEFKLESNNQLGKHIRHFNWIKVVCLVSLIISIGRTRLYSSYVH